MEKTEKPDYKYLCTVIGNLSGIPIRVFENGELTFFYSLVRLPIDPMCAYAEGINAIKDNVSYYATDSHQYYGVVNSGEVKIVIGPSGQIAPNDRELHELAFRADVPADDVADFVAGMKTVVCMPLESVLQILCTLNYVLNGEKKTLEDIAIYDEEQESLFTRDSQTRAEARFDAADGAQAGHNTYDLEQLLMSMIRKGDTAALREWVSSAPAVRGGVIAPDQLRQLKNTFIVTATLASRAAIRGGLPPETAFSLSDLYCQRTDVLTEVPLIRNLTFTMLMDFCEKVRTVRNRPNTSPLIEKCLHYISVHLHEPITLEQLSRHCGLCTRSLSLRFREETGMGVPEYIHREKLREAEYLLWHTDYSLSEITSFLNYPSQS